MTDPDTTHEPQDTTDEHMIDPTEWDQIVEQADQIMLDRIAAEPEQGGAGDGLPMNLTPRYFDYDDVPLKSSSLLRRQLYVVHTAECPLRVGYAQSLTAWGSRDYQPRSSWHRFVDPATVARWISLRRAAWHAAGANDRSVGYEQAGYASYSRDKWLTPEGYSQMDLLAQQIVKDGLPASGIRLLTDAQVQAIIRGTDRSTVGICTHEQVNRLSGRTSRTDPGRGYPLDVLVQFVDYYHPDTKTTAPPSPDADLPRRWFLTEDGVLDVGTRKAIQRMVGVKPDGNWGPNTRKAIQRWAGVTADGDMGPRTRMAVQRKVGAPQTGTWNWGWETKPDATTRYLEAYYNRAVRNKRQPI